MRQPLVNGNMVTPKPFKYIKLPGLLIERWTWGYKQTHGAGIVEQSDDDINSDPWRELRGRIGWVGFVITTEPGRIRVSLVQLVNLNRNKS